MGKDAEYLHQRARRMGHEASSFFEDKDLEIACKKFLERASKKDIIERGEARLGGMFGVRVKCRKKIGIVVDADGNAIETNIVRFVIVFPFSGYENKITHMPFKVASVYPVL